MNYAQKNAAIRKDFMNLNWLKKINSNYATNTVKTKGKLN